MKIVIDNQEKAYLQLLCAIKAEIKIIRTYKRLKRLKILTPKDVKKGTEEITEVNYLKTTWKLLENYLKTTEPTLNTLNTLADILCWK